MHYSKLRPTWTTMHHRCYNPLSKDFKNYGLKGVSVCPAWHNYSNFYNDLKDTWFVGASLDRKEVRGNYEPSNCEWIQRVDQTSVGKQSLRCNNKTGVIGVEKLQTGLYRVMVRERGWPRGKGPKRTLYSGTDFEAACAARAEWVKTESKILASSLKGSL